MTRRLTVGLTTALALLLVPQGLRGQGVPNVFGDDTQVVDRIAAVVGDSVILVSQIQEEIIRMRAQGAELPQEPEAVERLRRDLLQSLIDRQLLVQAALRDSLVSVDERRVDEVVQQEIQGRVRSFGGESALREALATQGLTLTEFRETLRAQARQDLLQQQFMAIRARGMGSVTIPEEEIREVFETRRAELSERPPEVTLAQMVVRPEPSDSARTEAREEAERILGVVRRGDEEFATLARRFSDDPGTRQQGGDLGWYRRGGGFVQEFEDAVFSLPEGRVSQIVETPFGFHLILVERARGAERKVRHILIRPEVTAVDVERARARAAEVRQALDEGEPMSEVRARFTPGAEPDTATIPVPRLDRALPPALADSVATAGTGAIIGPAETGEGSGTTLQIVNIVERREAGEYTLDDVREQIRRNLREQRIVERILQDLRDRAYIDIRI